MPGVRLICFFFCTLKINLVSLKFILEFSTVTKKLIILYIVTELDNFSHFG
jgi:hypothetical protein